MEIAHDVATGGAAKVWLAVRTPPTIISRQGPGGLPGDWIGTALLHFPARFGNAFTHLGSRQDFGDLSQYGLPVPEEGLMMRLRRDGTAPSIVDEEVIEAVKEGTVEVVGAVESLDSTNAGGQPSRRRSRRLPASAFWSTQAARTRSRLCPGRQSGPPRRSPRK